MNEIIESDLNVEEHEYTFINLTPHVINYYFDCGEICEIHPFGELFRLEEAYTTQEKVGKFNICDVTFYLYSELPQKIENVFYIVPAIVLSAIKQHFPERRDFVSPGTGNHAVRNEKGQIIGVKSFVR